MGSLFQEFVERGQESGEVLDELPIVVDESQEGSKLCDILWGWFFSDGTDFFILRSKSICRNAVSQVFN